MNWFGFIFISSPAAAKCSFTDSSIIPSLLHWQVFGCCRVLYFYGKMHHIIVILTTFMSCWMIMYDLHPFLHQFPEISVCIDLWQWKQSTAGAHLWGIIFTRHWKTMLHREQAPWSKHSRCCARRTQKSMSVDHWTFPSSPSGPPFTRAYSWILLCIYVSFISSYFLPVEWLESSW